MPQQQGIRRMGIKELAVDAVGISTATKTMAGGAGLGVVGWVSQVNWIGLSGVFIALLGFLLNGYFVYRRHQRERKALEADQRRKEELHQVRMDALIKRCDL